MKTEMVQSFMLKNGECFDSSIVIDIQKQLENVDDSKTALLMSLNLQKPTFILVIAILFGWERFFLDDTAMAIVKIITCYGCGIWWLVDIFSAKRRTYAYNYKKFLETISMCR